jgi:hypothetical protein
VRDERQVRFGVKILGRAPRELPDGRQRPHTILPLIDARPEVRVACTSDGQCCGAIANCPAQQPITMSREQ